MKRFVYILHHSYYYGKKSDYEEVKLLGVYSTKLMAEKAIKKYCKLPGFKDYPPECFSIDKYRIDKDNWKDGFVDTNEY